MKSKRSGEKGAPKKRRPDALARAQAEVDTMKLAPAASPGEATDTSEPAPEQAPAPHPADVLAEAAAVPVAGPGPLAEMPPTTAHPLRMADLSPHARRALVGLASNLHRTQSQLDAFQEDPTIPDDQRAPMGTSELVRLGLAIERRAHFPTPKGAELVARAGIDVTRPVATS